MNRIIMGVQIDKREDVAVKVQDLLTKHGCIIKTRLGMHDAGNFCSSHGLILVDFVEGKEQEIGTLITELNSYDGVDAQKMVFK